MLHLRPIPDDKASDTVVHIYAQIKSTFNSDVVPLVFQYLANFPEYLSYLWEKAERNITSNEFNTSCKDIQQCAHTAIVRTYQPSQQSTELLKHLSYEEKHTILQTASSLTVLNTKLYVFLIALRENIKGVFVGQKLLSSAVEKIDTYTMPSSVLYTGLKHANSPDELLWNTMLTPFYSEKHIQQSHLPEFFTLIDKEMKTLLNTEAYLAERVLLEQKALSAIANFPHPIGGSYQEIIQPTKHKPYFTEMIYLLVDTFPTAFARFLMTSTIMMKLLTNNNTSITF